MKAKASLVIASGLGLALWAGAASQGLFAQAESAPAAPPALPDAKPQPPKPVSDAERRSALNRRLSQMVSEGRGGRLTDAERPKPAPSPVRATPPRTATRRAVADGVRRPTGPSARPGAYVAPLLDLTTPVSRPSDPVACLAQTIYYEARSESEAGQAAVAEVVMNRAASGRYPRDICEVVYQRNTRTCQFTFTCDGSIGRFPVNSVAWARAERIAREVYTEGYEAILPKRSVNYHANYVSPRWSSRLERVNRIGAHIFYGAPLDSQPTPGAESPRPPASRNLLFVKNDAIERAYALLTGRRDETPSGS